MNAFIDKNTNRGYNQGSAFESTDLERVSFLAEKGFINAPIESVKKSRARKKASE